MPNNPAVPQDSNVAFQLLFQKLCASAKDFARNCSRLSAVPPAEQKRTQDAITLRLLQALAQAKNPILSELGMLEMLH